MLLLIVCGPHTLLAFSRGLSLYNNEYSENDSARLVKLDVDSLELRCLRFDLVQAMLHVIDYFAKSLKVTQDHSK